jgi:hypothetical protein
MRNTTVMTIIGLVAAAPAWADDSDASISQTLGNNNFATIDQTGTVNSQAIIVQWGSGNIAGYSIDFYSGGYHYHFDVPGISQQGSNSVIAQISQRGNGNEGNILHSSATNSSAILVQEGKGGIESNYNTGWMQQDGFNQDGRIDQLGEFNDAGTGQGQGTGNFARIGQIGVRNSAGISQYGSNTQGFIKQH